MTKKQSYIFVAFFACLLFAACANIGSPDGGDYDETPPRIVRTSPDYGSAKSSSKKIVLEFDENIKLENAVEKVVVSPPQTEQPEISAMGKRITVELLDTLVPNMTYTIDFADAIADNNEGNPMGDYAFTFSTGETLDTFQISGHVLNSSNLEPVKGMLVGLYSMEKDSLTDAYEPLADSAFLTKPFERISRSDSRGHFVIKGIAPGNYRVFALNDQNQNFLFDQKSEMIAFTDRVISPSSAPDIRVDTIWHDSIHYDSIVTVPYTHFYPDDIVLLAFQEKADERYLIKSERPVLHNFSLFFSSPSDTLPLMKGLNFDEKDAFIIDGGDNNDTLTYWIRDSLIYNLDTLEFQLSYFATDTTGVLNVRTDTLSLVSRLTKAKMEKQRQEDYKEWVEEYKEKMKAERKAKERAEKQKEKEKKDAGEDKNNAEEDKSDDVKKKKKDKDEEDVMEIPPMPEKFLEMKLSSTSLDPNKNIDFTFAEPLDTVYISAIHFYEKIDSLQEERRFVLKKMDKKLMSYRLYAEWEPEKSYVLEVDTGAFVDIYGKRSAGFNKTIKVKSLDSYSTLFVTLQNADTSAVVQLLDGNDKVQREMKPVNGKADFYFVTPGTYYMRMFYDRNGNGVWDTGNYGDKQQAEEVYYYPGSLALKAQWDVSQTWKPTATRLPNQKPEKITKQKPDKEKKVKSRNAERRKNKK